MTFVNILPKSEKKPQIPTPNNPFHHYMRRKENNSSLFLTPTDPMEISRIITCMKPKKSFGHDGISTNTLTLP